MKSTLLFLLILCCPLHAEFSLGMESSRIKRMRSGGTKQDGFLNGVRLSYDYFNRLYLGADYFRGSSRLDGHTGRNRQITSILTDRTYEGRVGYCFLDGGHFFSFFSGYGKFHEVNDFYPPTPVPFTFINTYSYIPVGFLSGVYLTSLVSMGFNFKVMFMRDAKSTVSDDPGRADVVLNMNEEINVRIETPFMLFPEHTRMNIRFSFVPFYEFRHYGGREGYPFNYIDTKYNLLGARVALVANF